MALVDLYLLAQALNIHVTQAGISIIYRNPANPLNYCDLPSLFSMPKQSPCSLEDKEKA